MPIHPRTRCREGTTCSKRSQCTPSPWHYCVLCRSDTEAHPESVCPDSPPFQLQDNTRWVVMVPHMESRAPKRPIPRSVPMSLSRHIREISLKIEVPPRQSYRPARDPAAFGLVASRQLIAARLVPGIHDIELPSRIRPRSFPDPDQEGRQYINPAS